MDPVAALSAAVAVVFPIFLLFRIVQWVDTYHGLIILYATFSLPFVIWMMCGYFRDVSVEVEERALVDGASRWRVLTRITLPLSIPGFDRHGGFHHYLYLERISLCLGLDPRQGRHAAGGAVRLFRLAIDLLGRSGRLVDRRHCANCDSHFAGAAPSGGRLDPGCDQIVGELMYILYNRYKMYLFD